LIALSIIVVGFIIVFSVSWPNIKGAPWVPTRMKKVRRMLELADVKPDDVVYDLGCGDGRIIVMAARKFGARAVGIEIDMMRFLWCQFLITILGLRRKVKVIYGDLFKKDLSNADVLICYLLQSTNNRLEDKLLEELQPTTRVISNTFMFHGLTLTNVDADLGILVYSLGIDESTNEETNVDEDEG
jgi:predicted RNA methylase